MKFKSNNMKRTNTAIRIATITQAGSNVPGRPGNLLINQVGEAKPENWFSSREFRNALLGQKLHPSLPLTFFKGAVIRCERLEITAEDITAGGGQVVIDLPGKDSMGNPRKATFKQPGVHNLNLTLDMDSIAMDKQMMMAELSMKFAPARTTTVTTTAPIVEAIVEDEVTAPLTIVPPAEEPKEDVLHTDLAQ